LLEFAASFACKFCLVGVHPSLPSTFSNLFIALFLIYRCPSCSKGSKITVGNSSSLPVFLLSPSPYIIPPTRFFLSPLASLLKDRLSFLPNASVPLDKLLLWHAIDFSSRLSFMLLKKSLYFLFGSEKLRWLFSISLFWLLFLFLMLCSLMISC